MLFIDNGTRDMGQGDQSTPSEKYDGGCSLAVVIDLMG